MIIENLTPYIQEIKDKLYTEVGRNYIFSSQDFLNAFKLALNRCGEKGLLFKGLVIVYQFQDGWGLAFDETKTNYEYDIDYAPISHDEIAEEKDVIDYYSNLKLCNSVYFNGVIDRYIYVTVKKLTKTK